MNMETLNQSEAKDSLEENINEVVSVDEDIVSLAGIREYLKESKLGMSITKTIFSIPF